MWFKTGRDSLIGLLGVRFADFPHHKLSNLKTLILFDFERMVHSKSSPTQPSPHMNYHNEFLRSVRAN